MGRRRQRLGRLGAVVAVMLVAGTSVASPAPAAVVPIKRTVVDVGPRWFRPRQVEVDAAHQRVLLVDPYHREMRVFTFAGKYVRQIDYLAGRCGGRITLGPNGTLYTATPREVDVRSLSTFAIVRRIPLPAVTAACVTTVALAGNRIWVSIVGRPSVVSTPIAGPGRWVGSVIETSAIAVDGPHGPTASSPYLLTITDPLAGAHISGATATQIPEDPRYQFEADGIGAWNPEGLVALNVALPDPTAPTNPQVGYYGLVLESVAHPNTPLRVLRDPLARYPDGIHTYPIALSTHHGWVATEGASSVQLLRWDRPGFVVLFPVNTRAGIPVDFVGSAFSPDGRKMFVVTANQYSPNTFGSDNVLSIYDVNVPNW